MTQLLTDCTTALVGALGQVDDDHAWSPTGCVGWTVRDLAHHLHADCIRALMAVHTPAGRPADTDAVSYWRDWGVDPEGAERDRRLTRVEAGLHGWTELRDRHAEAAAACARAVAAANPDSVVVTQGHAITVADLASTLVVEATLHHVDLVAHLTELAGPPPAALAVVRRVVEALLRRDLPDWSDERVALVGTGRSPATDAEARDLAGIRVPVFA